jgi:AcrR family transcriptional regulator
MSPRPYRLGQRQAAVEETRAGILAAARDLLGAEAGVPAFTIDAIARHAGVARMTVYYQFESKRGLLEALFDHFATRGLVQPLRAAFQQPRPLDALDALVAAFCGFWASDRMALRRIRGLAAIDPDIEVSVRARDARRREALQATLGRVAQQHPLRRPMEETVDVLQALTSFEMFDAVAGPSRTTPGVIDLVTDLVHADLGLTTPPQSGQRRQVERKPHSI